MNDSEALHAVRHGNSNALACLIDRYTPYVSAVIYNIIGSCMTQHDIEEVCSDVFLALWNNADKTDASRLKAYLGSIARNRAKNKLREMGTEIRIDDDIVLVSGDDLESEFLNRELTDWIRQFIVSMEQPDREIFLRHYYYCQPVAVIAEEMRMNVSTVKTRLSRGREKLRQKLIQGGKEYGIENHRSYGSCI